MVDAGGMIFLLFDCWWLGNPTSTRLLLFLDIAAPQAARHLKRPGDLAIKGDDSPRSNHHLWGSAVVRSLWFTQINSVLMLENGKNADRWWYVDMAMVSYNVNLSYKWVSIIFHRLDWGYTQTWPSQIPVCPAELFVGKAPHLTSNWDSEGAPTIDVSFFASNLGYIARGCSMIFRVSRKDPFVAMQSYSIGNFKHPRYLANWKIRWFYMT